MTFVLENFQVILPEVIVLLTACLALMVDLFCRSRSAVLSIATLGLVMAGIVSYSLFGDFKVMAFNHLFISDDLAHLMKIFIVLSVFCCFIYSRHYIAERQIPSTEYYVLALLSTLGMMILVSAHSLLTVYLGLELLSLPLYALTAIHRANALSSEAAMKYFVMGSIASGMLLFSFSLLYGATGKIDLLDIANAIALNWDQQKLLILFAMVLMIAGVAFKLAAFPFHMWAPDVYEGAPTAVTILISSAPKIAALGMALRLLAFGLSEAVQEWQAVLIALSCLSVIFGNLLALVQTNLKRLLAYSTVSHAGYALFGLLAANPVAYSASLYYILVYALMTIAAFGLLLLLSHNGLEVENIDDLKGLNKRNPWIAFMMLIVMFSMAGVPPTVGFITKLLVLKALVDVQLVWLAVVGLCFAVVGAYYYIRIVKTMYFDTTLDQTPISIKWSSHALFSINCLSLLYLGLFPAGLLDACVHALS